VQTTMDPQTYDLAEPLAAAVRASLARWEAGGLVRRLWARDASLWTGNDEAKWLGWLDAVPEQSARVDDLQRFAEEVSAAGFIHALLLGMGGSSLCPEVLARTFGIIPGYPELHVLDSTDPAQVRAVEARVDPARTLFIVSSKSGSTLEPNIFKEHFFARTVQIVGEREAGSRFVAVTDPGSHLQKAAERDGFRRVFFGVPSIGGRFSALSNFGLVPAAVMGLDVRRFLNCAMEMVNSCGAGAAAEENPGVVLGTILGVLAGHGRDKVTLVISPGILDLGAWLEQLLAESTGKDGKALIPVDRERIGPPSAYGDDRLFVYLRLETAPDAAQDAAVEALARAGQPLVRIAVENVYNLGAEFFRWEIATAVAGAILGVNPFDQPDVEASKVATRELTQAYERSGRLPEEAPIFAASGIALFTDDGNASALRGAAGSEASLARYLRAHLERLRPGDYFAVLAYIEMNEEHEQALQVLRHAARDRWHVATCLGFGPRFLHSTGQAYKGGPNSGVFLQITCDDAEDLPIPGRSYSFGIVKAAQARGDLQVLAERGRRVLRVHLPAETGSGLERLLAAVGQALG
jgi:transaldolase/glucose-6-phosphate isomerase